MGLPSMRCLGLTFHKYLNEHVNQYPEIRAQTYITCKLRASVYLWGRTMTWPLRVWIQELSGNCRPLEVGIGIESASFINRSGSLLFHFLFLIVGHRGSTCHHLGADMSQKVRIHLLDGALVGIEALKWLGYRPGKLLLKEHHRGPEPSKLCVVSESPELRI